MDLLCYLYPGWQPRIRAAQLSRDWMDRSPESFAYRCLPLNIANMHGWEVLCPTGFSAMWNGGNAPEDVTILPDNHVDKSQLPEALFGMGTITFHLMGLMRTSPGWNLWVNGPPNRAKDGIAPLGGIIETDWLPFSFTMNWRLTRPHEWVRFEENEPFAFFFPVQRDMIETVDPRCLSIDEDPALKIRFEEWSQSRTAFQQEMKAHPPTKPSDKWQKFYYRGTNASGEPGPVDHRTKLRVREFANAPSIPATPPQCPIAKSPPSVTAKRDWLLTTLERQRNLSTEASSIRRVKAMSGQQFLDEHYATNRPVILCDAISDWPALTKWTPDYLRHKAEGIPVVFQSRRQSNPRFERDKDAHREQRPFEQFLDLIMSGSGNDAYLTAYNSADNAQLTQVLSNDLGHLDAYMDRSVEQPFGMPWIGPEGTFTPLHHDLTNNMLIQITGRKRILMAAPGEASRLYNDQHVFSAVQNLETYDPAQFPLTRDVTIHRIELQPGEILFLPIGWWHQVLALDFSVSLTQTHFRWPNDAWASYPKS